LKAVRATGGQNLYTEFLELWTPESNTFNHLWRELQVILILREARPVGKPRRRKEENIKMSLTQTGCKGADWIHVAQDRVLWPVLVHTVMNYWVQ